MLIHLLTGPVRSGKTTRLRHWAQHRSDAGGVLMLASAHQQRYFLDLRTGLQWPATAHLADWQALQVGPFRFSAAAFYWAEAALLGAVHDGRPYVVLDEIGPLELRGQGLAPALEAILAAAPASLNLVLVVRAGLVEQVWQRFGLHRWPMTSFQET